MKQSTYVRWFLIILLAGGSALAAAKDAPLRPTILVFGDSLSAGYGIDPDLGWVNLLQKRLSGQGYPYQVVNASISGETTSGGLARLPAALGKYHPSLVVIELGANDGLRGLSLEKLRANLAAMIEQSQAGAAKVLLLGMRLPPNYGPTYTKRFHGVFEDLSTQYKTGLEPFFLDGVAGKPDLVQADGLHPRAEGQPALLENVWISLQPLLSKDNPAL